MAKAQSWLDGLLSGPTGPAGTTGPTGPAGAGFTSGDVSVSGTVGTVVGVEGIPINFTGAPTGPAVLIYNTVTGQFDVRQSTDDDKGAALTVTLSGGSGGVFECGATWTLTGLTASPACNAVGVTAATLKDIINGVTGTTKNVFSVPNTISGSNLPALSYTKSGSGDVVDLQLSLTSNGVSKLSSLGSVRGLFYDRYALIQDTVSGATGASISGTTFSLTGGGATGTATGVLVSGSMAVNTAFSWVFGSTPKYGYLVVMDGGATATFFDVGQNASFPTTRVADLPSLTNQFSVSHHSGLYRTNNLLSDNTFSLKRLT